MINNYANGLKDAFGDSFQDEKELFHTGIASVHLGKRDYETPEIIIIHKNYEVLGDLNKDPENKASLYFYTSSVMGLKSHFQHSKVQEDPKQRQKMMRKIAELFDYTNPSDNTNRSQFEIDLDQF